MISLRETDVLTETGYFEVQRVRMRLPCSDGATLNNRTVLNRNNCVWSVDNYSFKI